MRMQHKLSVVSRVAYVAGWKTNLRSALAGDDLRQLLVVAGEPHQLPMTHAQHNAFTT